MSNEAETTLFDERRLRLLLVEDNQDDVQMFVDLISDHVKTPMDLSLASSLVDAANDLKTHDYDVILLDITLYYSDGPHTYKALREHAKGAPIVILSGHDDEDAALRALGDGVQDYLVKGKVDGSLLMRSIRYAIERQHLIDKLKEVDSKMAALTSLLPVCSSCKKVRSEDGNWSDLETYLRTYTRTKVQQTLCPACGRRYR